MLADSISNGCPTHLPDKQMHRRYKIRDCNCGYTLVSTLRLAPSITSSSSPALRCGASSLWLPAGKLAFSGFLLIGQCEFIV